MTKKDQHPSFKRLVEVAAQFGIEGPSAIGKALNESDQVMTNWASRGISKRGAIACQARFGISPKWLIDGQGQSDLKIIPLPIAVTSNVSPAPALASSTWLPVVGHVKAGPDGYLEEMQYPVGHGEGYVEYWTKDPSAYALRIKGDSMHPRYRAGEYIVVTPAIEPQPGRDVVVKLKNGLSLLKQLNWIRSGEVQLLSINNGYAPHTISFDEIESIQRVAGSVAPDAFSNERPTLGIEHGND